MSILALLTPNTHHISYMESSSYDNCITQKESMFHQRELLRSSSINCRNKIDITGMRNSSRSRKLDWKTYALWPESRPAAIEMEPILDSDQLDQALIMAQSLSQPIIIDWVASWCRKCIYLKPKLEKLAAEYHNKIKFYCVDVNKVPQALVKRGNVTKMPTIQVGIQLWKDGEKKAEVIGGHKAWLVVEEVKEMMQQYLP